MGAKIRVCLLLPGALLGQTEGQTRMELRKEVNHGDLTSILEIDRNSLSRDQKFPLQVTFTIRNETGQPIPVTFRSAQQYDFVVEDAEGRPRWRWSSGKFFAMIIMEKELAGDPWVYREKIPAFDDQGRPLPPGTYRLKAKLVCHLKGIENSIPFRVE